MGRIAKLLSFVRLTKNEANVSDVKVNPGGGFIITAEHFADAGDDSHPLTTDYVALNTDRGTGREYAIGYLDPLNEPKAQPGDKRIYSREPSEDGAGRVIAEQWLKNDGTVITNAYKLVGSDIKLISRVTQSPDNFVSSEVFDENDTLKVTTKISSDGACTLFNENGSLTLNPDGSIAGANGSGQFELESGGDFVANGAKMTTDGDVQTSEGISLREHVHVGNLGANTSPPVP